MTLGSPIALVDVMNFYMFYKSAFYLELCEKPVGVTTLLVHQGIRRGELSSVVCAGATVGVNDMRAIPQVDDSIG